MRTAARKRRADLSRGANLRGFLMISGAVSGSMLCGLQGWTADWTLLNWALFFLGVYKTYTSAHRAWLCRSVAREKPSDTAPKEAGADTHFDPTRTLELPPEQNPMRQQGGMR